MAGSQPPRPALEQAGQAFREGRYPDVDALLARLDGRDPAVAALEARAAIARGRYPQADALLTPVTWRAPGSDAALVLARLDAFLGRRVQARQTFEALVAALEATPGGSRTPQEQARLAAGYEGLGRFQDANALFRAAARAAPDDPAINTAWGRLLLDKHNPADAIASFRGALKADPAWEPALVGLAQAAVDADQPQAHALLEQALALNPADVDARLLVARLALDDGHPGRAVAALQQALAVNPSSPQAHALLASLAYLEGRSADYQRELGRALAVTPASGEAYRIVADEAARHYRFDEAVALVRQAVALDPDDARAQADLGLDLLRTGDEAGARVALDRAFKTDPYDVVTYNLLGLLDTLGRFTTVRDGDLAIRLSPDEAPVLRPYIVPLARQALATLSKEYGFTPAGPILIEVFPHHDDFAVRNLGLPGMIGVLGACFGRVVTMDSPSARPPGTFFWEATLWHELAHVVTLQMSRDRVPRWLTEGISVYEEQRARPEWGRALDVPFALAMEHGQVLPLSNLDAGFGDPRRVSLAYDEASLFVAYLVRVYGQTGLNALLRAYGDGLDTGAALKKAFGVGLAELQIGFTAALDRQFGPLRQSLRGPDAETLRVLPLPSLAGLAQQYPVSYPVMMAYARALRWNGNIRQAMAVYERAAELVPTATGDDSPHAIVAGMAIQGAHIALAISELQALLRSDHDNLEAARQLAALLKTSTDTAALQAVYGRIAALDPFDASAHTELGRLALQRRDTATALREFQVALAAGPADRAAAYCDLAETDDLAGHQAEAKRETLAALEIAPLYARAQDLLLKLVGDSP